ncbi:DUF6270 domain-containing protein [Paenibacillus lautus]|uniref:DUF6270 domain-containing protein n=1 Tax=Paenibacillus lautus TaxID=1401 RepID=UPI002DBEBA16|nr:DUF6270 domain-containing protein [Paenibacillus lautus]MEC0258394.1 DUF6270 domain-containing protein [Paenibacillus lautus]
MNYFIFGSCVSRDIFNYSKDHNVVDYFARSSIVSVTSKPLDISEEEILLESDFRRRMLRRDLRKDFINVIKETPFDYLIIDFIDERLDLLKLDNKYYTRSNEFVSSNLEHTRNFELIKRNSANAIQLWYEACSIYVEQLTSIVQPSKIILHKTFWAKKVFDDGQESQFDPEYQKFIDTNNELLSLYYNFFISLVPDVRILEVDSKYRISNKGHMWGLAPFHYIDEYYMKALDDLSSLTNI